MSHRMTFDASLKVKGSTHVRNWVRHVFRDADKANGVEVRHANPNVDAARTHLNQSRLIVERDGRLVAVKVTDSQQVLDAIDARLGDVKKPLRKDAVVMRPLVLQIGSEWYDEHSPGWREGNLSEEAKRLHARMLGFAVAEFGARNVVGYSLHLDETSPQFQIAFVPVTDDGRLSQKDFFSGPAQMRGMHARLREHMIAGGFDVERESSSRSRERLSVDGYARAVEKIKGAEAEATRVVEHAHEQARTILEDATATADTIRNELPELHRRTVEQAKAEGLAQGRAEVTTLAEQAMADATKAALDAQIAAQARREAEAEREKFAALTSSAVPNARWLGTVVTKHPKILEALQIEGRKTGRDVKVSADGDLVVGASTLEQAKAGRFGSSTPVRRTPGGPSLG